VATSFSASSLTHGARAPVLWIKRAQAWIGAWLDTLDARVPKNVVLVAMADKLRDPGNKMGVPKDATNAELKQLEEEFATECQVSDTSAGIDDSTTSGSPNEIDVIERGDAICHVSIRSAIVGTIEDIVGIYLEAKR